MNNILLKGKSSSTASNSELEQADSAPTIRLLTTKYGLTKGSKYRADWEPATTSGKCMAGVPGVFWRSPVVL